MSRPRIVAAGLAVAIAAVDQGVGWFVAHEAWRLPWRVTTGVVIEIAHNTGISFSRFSGGGGLLLALIAVVCVGLAIGVWRAPVRYALPLAVILGGAAGNLIDRLRFGYVIDYVAIGPWPTFNLGDVAIAVGAVLVALAVLRSEPRSAGDG